MKQASLYALVLFCLLSLYPLVAAGKKDAESPAVSAAKEEPGSTAAAQTKDGEIPVSSAGQSKEAQSTPETGEKKTEDNPTAKEKPEQEGEGKEAPAAPAVEGKTEKEGTDTEAIDPSFASIQNTGLTVADGNKWYYESFDRQGRSAFAVLYEGDTAVEKTVWTYDGAALHPTQKEIFGQAGSEIIRYDDAGRELVIERYEGSKLTSKTENVYNGGGKLIEQTVTAGKNVDKSVWDFAVDKAVSQTKYRNGKKTAFIELHSEPHIVHLYIDDKEVLVTEEQ